MIEIAIVLLAVMLIADQIEITLWEIHRDRQRAEVRRRHATRAGVRDWHRPDTARRS